jgi:hypothetical protein
MDFTFDLLQGAGIAAAIGIRPLLPVLLVGLLASMDAGLDFDATSFEFLEQPAFLLGVVVGVALLDIVRRRSRDWLESNSGVAALGALAVALGALEAAGSLADRDHPVLAGIVVGAACAVLGLVATRSLFERVRGRLDAGAAAALPLYQEGLALVVAGLSIAFPPLAIVAIAFLVWLLIGSRRREGEKYAGLRILR